jgi:ribokinase
MNKTILVAGDINHDLILRGDVKPRFHQAEQLLSSADLTQGGSAAIFACALARLGASVQIVGAVGADEFGKLAETNLSIAGVGVNGIHRVPGSPTGLSVHIVIGTDRAIMTSLGAIGDLRGEQVRAMLTPEICHLHAASYFLQPIFSADLINVFSSARDNGITTSLDTNWDPAEKWIGLDRVFPYVDIFLPNQEELLAIGRVLFPEQSTAESDDRNMRVFAQRIAELGPTVVIKRGREGAIAVSSEGELAVADAVSVEIVDSIGAGDTFDAAFIKSWLDGASVPRALKFAAIAGSFSLRGVGGTSSQPRYEEIVSLLRED